MPILMAYRPPSYHGNTITACRFLAIKEFFLNRETKKPTSLSSDILAARIHRNPAAATRISAMWRISCRSCCAA
jgi:hypothetical protein